MLLARLSPRLSLHIVLNDMSTLVLGFVLMPNNLGGDLRNDIM